MAAPERAARTASVFSIASTAPFLDTLARALTEGKLPGGAGEPPDPVALSRMTVLLPTRRAVRGLREAFLHVAPTPAALLPRIRAIGDPDEIEALQQTGEAGFLGDAEGAELPPAIRPLERRLALARLVRAWRQKLFAEAVGRGAEAPERSAQALALADELAAFLDVVDAEQVRLEGLADLVPADFATHWQLTLDFLAILTEHWPVHLAERGRLSPVARRNALLAAEVARLETAPPADPVVAAGSTGTAPATLALLAAIARLPNGAVVLPGLDASLDPEAWDAVASHPEHPQFGLCRLLDHLGMTREEVIRLPAPSSDAAAARERLIATAMRPASAPPGKMSKAARAQMIGALRPITVLAAASAEDEAEAIALILRGAIETPGKTAQLITPDRDLARRVSARLLRWNLTVDDSAGKPVAETVPGAFLQLVADAAAQDFAAPVLMALLKHPLARLGWTAGEARAHARALELLVFRGQYGVRGLDAIRARLEEPEEDGYAHPARKRLGSRDRKGACALRDRLTAAYAPLRALGTAPTALAALAEAHAAAAEALARDEAGDTTRLWRGEAGEALALFLAELIAEADAGFLVTVRAYPAAYRALAAGLAVRTRTPAHPRLTILGTLEARLQHADLVILGGLNEGVWPRAVDSGPWLSRPMRKVLGLPSPERLIGLAAHDFTQALGAPEVFLTRAAKIDGAQTVPSRWLQRLGVLRQGLGVTSGESAETPWLGWARDRDKVPILPKARVPAPTPPVASRPSGLSISGIEKWMASPYTIYARNILELEPMPPLARGADAALRGTLVHDALHIFGERYPHALPDDPERVLIDIARELFERHGDHAPVSAFWRPQFGRFAKWFAETERARRLGVDRVFTEVSGRLPLGTERGFTLSARADRIDVRADGSLAIYDYKTGTVPKPGEVADRRAPQLLLEAAIGLGGGFADVTPAGIARLAYIRASGGRIEGEECEVAAGEAEKGAAEALARLTALVRTYEDAATPYPALRRPTFEEAYRFDDFAHLARVLEWSAEEPLE